MTQRILQAEKEEQLRQEKARSERESKVKELFDLAEKARQNQEYENGITTLERLLTIDPTTLVATDLGATGIPNPVALTETSPFFSDGFESGDTSGWSSAVQ